MLWTSKITHLIFFSKGNTALAIAERKQDEKLVSIIKNAEDLEDDD